MTSTTLFSARCESSAEVWRQTPTLSRRAWQLTVCVGCQVSGTKSGFFGEQVELKSKYEQLGYIKGDGTSDSKIGSIVGAGVALVGVLATLVALSSM